MLELIAIIIVSCTAGLLIGMLGTFFILDWYRRRQERQCVGLILGEKWRQAGTSDETQESNIIPYPDPSRH